MKKWIVAAALCVATGVTACGLTGCAGNQSATQIDVAQMADFARQAMEKYQAIKAEAEAAAKAAEEAAAQHPPTAGVGGGGDGLQTDTCSYRGEPNGGYGSTFDCPKTPAQYMAVNPVYFSIDAGRLTYSGINIVGSGEQRTENIGVIHVCKVSDGRNHPRMTCVLKNGQTAKLFTVSY
jgi:hypothetical protein